MTKSPAANCLGSPLSAALHMASTPGAEVFREAVCYKMMMLYARTRQIERQDYWITSDHKYNDIRSIVAASQIIITLRGSNISSRVSQKTACSEFFN